MNSSSIFKTSVLERKKCYDKRYSFLKNKMKADLQKQSNVIEGDVLKIKAL